MNLNETGRAGHKINQQNGWDVFTTQMWDVTREPPFSKEDCNYLCTNMALIHTEVSEATEAVRKHDRTNFEEELADIIIRVTSIAHGMGIDLDRAVNCKLAANMTRGYRHGGKAV